jgi:hypothetical protein
MIIFIYLRRMLIRMKTLKYTKKAFLCYFHLNYYYINHHLSNFINVSNNSEN